MPVALPAHEVGQAGIERLVGDQLLERDGKRPREQQQPRHQRELRPVVAQQRLGRVLGERAVMRPMKTGMASRAAPPSSPRRTVRPGASAPGARNANRTRPAPPAAAPRAVARSARAATSKKWNTLMSAMVARQPVLDRPEAAREDFCSTQRRSEKCPPISSPWSISRTRSPMAICRAGAGSRANIGGRFLARGGINTVLEGGFGANRVNVPSFPRPRRPRPSEFAEYQAARQKQIGAADFTMMLCDGV